MRAPAARTCAAVLLAALSSGCSERSLTGSPDGSEDADLREYRIPDSRSEGWDTRELGGPDAALDAADATDPWSDLPEGAVPPVILGDVSPCEVDLYGNECIEPFECCISSTWSWEGGDCVDTRISTTNCGGCGRLCPFPARCVDGLCRPPAGYSLCGCAWADLTTDPDHCGACGNACPESASCVEGSCSETESECAGGQVLCGEGCRSLGTVQHCESCGHKCWSLEGICPEWECSPVCGECRRADRWWGGDVLGWDSYERTGRCTYGIMWFRNQCLEDCPEGYYQTREMTTIDSYRRLCVPYAFDESGLLYSFNDRVPICGEPYYRCGGSGSSCIDGDCLCMEGYTACDNAGNPHTSTSGTTCVDTSASWTCCGECWHFCETYEECIDGTCV